MLRNAASALLGLLLFCAPAHAAEGPLFTRADGLSGAGRVVAEWTAKARLHGLALTPDPAVAAWASRPADATPDATAQARVEAALSDHLARLVADLPPAPREQALLNDPDHGFYLSPDVVWRDAPARAASPDALAAARQAALDGSLDAHLRALLPAHPQYLRLVAAAERYAALCEAGGWGPTPRPPARKPKAPRARVKFKPPADATALQGRLAREGYLAPDAVTGHWDAATDAALARFLEAHQLPQRKGLFEADLYDALDVPCEARLATLALNARRWRHSAWRGEPTFVEVNIAAQELRYLRDHALVMAQRTIVGSDRWYFDKDLKRRVNVRATPVLTEHISRVVLNPTWAVPPRIAKNMIEKELAKDPGYLEKNNITRVESPRGVTYIQAPGEDNALGVIKILFPNSESIYLHDTPKKGPFKLAVRALSHGCVRVQNAVDFGMALLTADAAASGRPFSEGSQRARIGRGGPVIFDLAVEVPVFLEYYTASVTDDGLVRFHPDIYAYDAELGDLTVSR